MFKLHFIMKSHIIFICKYTHVVAPLCMPEPTCTSYSPAVLLTSAAPAALGVLASGMVGMS